MAIPEQLRPNSHRLVIDLVADAGHDVSDWSNYAGQHPSSNPRYCYEWVFTQDGLPSIACLWIDGMEQQPNGSVQTQLNLWKVAQSHESTNGRGAVAKRARALDIALQTAFRTQAPIRVIVVDGDQADLVSQNKKSSRVQRRRLDSSFWTVTEYDWTSGNCLLVRSDTVDLNESTPPAHKDILLDSAASVTTATESRPTYVARLAYNSQHWRRPATSSEVQEAGETYRNENGFGHEDWLFREEWVLDGWRYGFVQGVNSSRVKLLRERSPFDLRLFTMPAPGERRAVAEIFNVECLSDEVAQAAIKEYERRGWLDEMRREVIAAGGRPEALDDTSFAPHLLNLRYRPQELRFLDQSVPFPTDDPVHRLKRYGLYSTSGAMNGASERMEEQEERGGLLTVEDYCAVLTSIEMPAPQRRWLISHYYFPDSTASMLQLSNELGYADHRAANGAYGPLARKVAEQLPRSPDDVEDGGYRDWMQSIAVLTERNVLGHSQWRLRDQVVGALLAMGWVEPLSAAEDAQVDPPTPEEMSQAKDYGLDDTQVRQMMLSRRGQGKFRNDTLRFWSGCCAVSGLNDCRLLIASHIKPWRHANPKERLDGMNGLPLTPNLDRAFDRGLISFAADGSILISSQLSEASMQALGVHEGLALRLQDPRIECYMAHHRESVFVK